MVRKIINEKNMNSFGEYEPLVRWWCNKHKMVWVMPEFKELFDEIRIMDEKIKTPENRK